MTEAAAAPTQQPRRCEYRPGVRLCTWCGLRRPNPGEAERECNPPRDVREIFARMPRRPLLEDEVQHRPVTAVDTRLGWYIPKRFERCVLQLCPAPSAEGRCECADAHHFVAHTPSQRVAHEAATAWANAVGTGKGLALALVGNVGTGKSHLIYAAVRHAILRGVNAGAWGWASLADHMRVASAPVADHGRKEEAITQRARAKAVRAIALDEIRPTSGTDYDGTALGNLMTEAYRECQDVFVTSNYADRELAGIVGLAAASRLTQLTIVGPDYRKPGKLA